MSKNPAAVALGRLGGSVTSKRKAKAVRENGKKGGRPKRPKPYQTVADHPAHCCPRVRERR